MIRLLIFQLLVAGSFGATLVSLTGKRSTNSACCTDDGLIACDNVAVSFENLGSAEIDLPHEISLPFKNLVKGNDNAYYYESSEGSAVLTYNPKSGGLHGHTLTAAGDSFVLEYCGEAGHVWKQLDNKNMKEDLAVDFMPVADRDALFPPLETPPEMYALDNTTEYTYTVMFYYTAEFAADTPDIDGFLDQVIAETNQGYANSLVPLKIQKFCQKQTSMSEPSGSASAYLGTFSQSEGSYEATRNTADVAALLVKSFDYCGIAYTHAIPSGATFSVTMKSCATGYYSFGHEIGHNIGLMHDPAQSSNSVWPYGLGHLIAAGTAATGYRTILAYNANGHSTRVNYYSNPSVIYPTTGTPTGVAGVSNNAAVLIYQKAAVAAVGDETGACASATTTAAPPVTTSQLPVTTTMPATTTKPQPPFTLFSGKKTILKKLKVLKKKTAKACAMECSNTPGCEYITWRKRRTRCFLLAVGFANASGHVAGKIN